MIDTRIRLPDAPAIPGHVVRAFDPTRDYPSFASLIAAAHRADAIDDLPSAEAIRVAPDRAVWPGTGRDHRVRSGQPGALRGSRHGRRSNRPAPGHPPEPHFGCGAARCADVW